MPDRDPRDPKHIGECMGGTAKPGWRKAFDALSPERRAELERDRLDTTPIKAPAWTAAQLGVPPKFYGAKAEDFSKAIRAKVPQLRDLYPGILITGPVGVGKTRLMAAILRAWMPRLQRECARVMPHANPTRYVRWEDERHTHRRIEADPKQEGAHEAALVRLPYYFWDDIARGYTLAGALTSGYKAAERLKRFGEVLKQRWHEETTTMMTTNLSLSMWAAIDPRIAAWLGRFTQIGITQREDRT